MYRLKSQLIELIIETERNKGHDEIFPTSYINSCNVMLAAAVQATYLKENSNRQDNRIHPCTHRPTHTT